MKKLYLTNTQKKKRELQNHKVNIEEQDLVQMYTEKKWPISTQRPAHFSNLEPNSNFHEHFVEFVTNFTLHCYHWIVESKRSKYER